MALSRKKMKAWLRISRNRPASHPDRGLHFLRRSASNGDKHGGRGGEHGRRPGLDQGGSIRRCRGCSSRWREGTQPISVWPPPSSAPGPQEHHAPAPTFALSGLGQDANKFLRNLVRRLEHEEPGFSRQHPGGAGGESSRLPHGRSLACTSRTRSAVRQVTRNVKRHADGAQMVLEAQKTSSPQGLASCPSSEALQNT